MTSRSIHQWLTEYGESHKNKVNKLIHWICVPGIFLTIVGLLWSIPVPSYFAAVPYLNWATLTMVPVVLFYLQLSPRIALGMIAFSFACLGLVDWYDQLSLLGVWQTSTALFVVFWIMQFIGHHIEGKKPSFFEDLQFLLIGPAWVIGFLYRKVGIQY